MPLLRLEPAWVDLDLEVLAEPLGKPAGGLLREASWIQQTTLALTLQVPTDPARSPGREWERWTMHVAIDSFNGDPLYAQRLGAVLSLQEAANPVELWLTPRQPPAPFLRRPLEPGDGVGGYEPRSVQHADRGH